MHLITPGAIMHVGQIYFRSYCRSKQDLNKYGLLPFKEVWQHQMLANLFIVKSHLANAVGTMTLVKPAAHVLPESILDTKACA